jgi:hypothetical protein
MVGDPSRRDLALGAGTVAAGTLLSDAAAEASDTGAVADIRKENFRRLSEATVRVGVLGAAAGIGSGYHFLQPDIIVTNAHVALDPRAEGQTLYAESEVGRWTLKILATSPPTEFDYAIMRAVGQGLQQSQFLRPELSAERGDQLLYAGYPHGIDPLIVAAADVTSPRKGNNFTFNGLIHGGNSGGPVVNATNLHVKGTVTARRFFTSPEMEQADREMQELQVYLQSVQSTVSVQIMGVDFGKFAYALSRIASLTNELNQLNSTTGIGIANSIEPVIAGCKSVGIV